MKKSYNGEYPLIAFLKLFTERDNVKKEAKRVQRANKAARKGSSKSLSLKDYSKERSNKERLAQSFIINP